MSQLKLSAQLVEQMQQMLVQHDESASDPGVASQYLAAIVGFLLGQQDMPADRKQEILEELGAFMKHVADDVEKQRSQAAPPPPARPPQEAFGIWKPPAS